MKSSQIIFDNLVATTKPLRMSILFKVKNSCQKINFISICCVLLFNMVMFAQEARFDISKDLLLTQFDLKTDVDDLHTIAGFATVLKDSDYNDLNYHAIAGTYGVQEGLYVPPNELMKLAFNKNWSDAHNKWEAAVNKVVKKANKAIKNGGSVWVGEAGQSDFTEAWIKKLAEKNPLLNIKEKIHVVQHSDWNESVTAPNKLTFVQNNTDYHKIPDGNAVGNGTPGFKSDGRVNWESHLNDEHLTLVWNTAIRLGNEYNGKDGRYMNESVVKGGLDFSDLSEVCYILNLTDLKDANAFFEYFEVQ